MPLVKVLYTKLSPHRHRRALNRLLKRDKPDGKPSLNHRASHGGDNFGKRLVVRSPVAD